MGTTIKDIARRAGVSPATVSRILGNYGYAADATRKRVLRASRELNYRPNSIAKSMVKGTTKSIGLVVADISNPFFVAVISEVEDQARRRGYSLLVSNAAESHEIQQEALNSLLERQVDGLILVPVDRTDPALLRDITAHHRIVCLDRSVEGVPADFVLFDNRGITQKYCREFLQDLQEHQQIALIYPDQQVSPVLQRIEGFNQTLTELGISEHRVIRVACGYRAKEAYDAVSSMLKDVPCTRFFTLDYQMTSGTLKALFDQGMIGRDRYHLLTFDDIGFTGVMLPYRITPIIQPIQQLARTALHKLIERIEQPGEIHAPITITLSG